MVVAQRRCPHCVRPPQTVSLLEEAVLPPAVRVRNVVSIAVDGSTTGDVTARQLPRLPPATHIIISTGGNDALQARHAVVTTPVSSAAEALVAIGAIQEAFEARMRALLDGIAAAAPGVPVLLFAPYNPNVPPGLELMVAKTGLSFYADVIYRLAAARSLSVVDLRLLFDSEADYANAIEPSPVGGLKIGRKIVEFVASRPPEWVTGGGSSGGTVAAAGSAATAGGGASSSGGGGR